MKNAYLIKKAIEVAQDEDYKGKKEYKRRAGKESTIVEVAERLACGSGKSDDPSSSPTTTANFSVTPEWLQTARKLP